MLRISGEYQLLVRVDPWFISWFPTPEMKNLSHRTRNRVSSERSWRRKIQATIEGWRYMVWEVLGIVILLVGSEGAC